ncbi:MAG: HD domain-containing protein [Clostridia bacterium]|nr:HD domain-containing protein [Clostridia bacterium]
MDYPALITLLRTETAAEKIDARREEIAQWIPECRIMFDYDQEHPHHPYDLWMHCLHTLTALPRNIDDDMLYLAALLHDIGKPAVRQGNFSPDHPGGMYHGHAVQSARIIREQIIPGMLARNMPLDDEAQARLIYYAGHHDDHIGMDADAILAAGKDTDPALYGNLLHLEIADSMAHAPVPLMLMRIAACREVLLFLAPKPLL